jgi:hypothetical protein
MSAYQMFSMPQLTPVDHLLTVSHWLVNMRAPYRRWLAESAHACPAPKEPCTRLADHYGRSEHNRNCNPENIAEAPAFGGWP